MTTGWLVACGDCAAPVATREGSFGAAESEDVQSCMSWNASPQRPMHLLYDGSCRFCTAGSERLVGMAAPGVIVRVSSKDEAGMARLPARAREGIGGALQLVSPDGEVASGAEAVNRALATRALWRLITWLYWVPGIRQITDAMYRVVARNRYRIMGKVETCETGACEVK